MKQNASLLKKIELPRTPAEWLEAVMNFLFFLCGILAVGCVVLISVYMIASGVPAIRKIGLFRFQINNPERFVYRRTTKNRRLRI